MYKNEMHWSYFAYWSRHHQGKGRPVLFRQIYIISFPDSTLDEDIL